MLALYVWLHTCAPVHMAMHIYIYMYRCACAHTQMFINSLLYYFILLRTDLCPGTEITVFLWRLHVTYLSSLLRTILILSFKGRFFSGMENQVFRPIITRFCLPTKTKQTGYLWKRTYIFSVIHRQDTVVIVTSSGYPLETLKQTASPQIQI